MRAASCFPNSSGTGLAPFSFDVTLFVTDEVDAPFDTAGCAHPPDPRVSPPPRFRACVDTVNRAEQLQCFFVTERPHQRMQAYDAVATPVWSLPESTIPNADLVMRVRAPQGLAR